jgi:hypothetical protein
MHLPSILSPPELSSLATARLTSQTHFQLSPRHIPSTSGTASVLPPLEGTAQAPPTHDARAANPPMAEKLGGADAPSFCALLGGSGWMSARMRTAGSHASSACYLASERCYAYPRCLPSGLLKAGAVTCASVRTEGSVRKRPPEFSKVGRGFLGGQWKRLKS